MPQVATRALVLALATGLSAWISADPARADGIDACISAAEQSQVERRDGHLRAARDKLLFCARDACPKAIRRDCARWLGEVEGILPSVVLRAVDADGGDVVHGRVLVDGVALADALDGRAVAVDPGEHEFRVEVGKSAVVQRVVVREGERDRLLSLKLPPAAPTAPKAVPAGVWVLAGLGAASATLGVALWVKGRSERADLYATCGVKHDCSPSAVDGAKLALVGGDVAWGVALASAGGALWWALAARSSPRIPVDAQPVAGGALVRWSGMF